MRLPRSTLLAVLGVTRLLAETDAELAARAAALHARIFTIDTHLDTPSTSLRRPGWNFAERHDPLMDLSQCDLPRMREGGLKAGVFVVGVLQGARTREAYALIRDNALRSFMRINALAARHPDHCELALTVADGLRIAPTGKRALYLSIENGYVIGRDLTLLKTYHDLGARFFGIVHSKNNDLADASTDSAEWNGLSALGRNVVAECNRLGLVLDASHASDAATREMLSLSQTPIILTHSGCKAICDHVRNIDDDLLRELAARGGVIQINSVSRMTVPTPADPQLTAKLAPLMIRAANVNLSDLENANLLREYFKLGREMAKSRATLDDFMKHVFHAIDVAGVDHVGIGPDMDGGGGVTGLEDVSDYPKITHALLKRGLSEPDVEKIWGGNTLRVLRAAEEYASQNRTMARSASTEGTVMEEFMIPAGDRGIELYVRNKRPRNLTTFRPDNVVLFVHGATYPAETTFDLQLDGLSWMDYIAQRGHDVYLVDVRGYGKSTRPPEMNEPPERNPPIARTNVAARDYGSAVDFILRRRAIAKLNVMGWSWGTAIAGLYTSQNNSKVNRLILFAPGWLRQSAPLTDPGGTLGAYRIVTPAIAKERMKKGWPAGTRMMPHDWLDAWTKATFATDPLGAMSDPPFIRAPSGSVLDAREYWSAGKSVYDPSEIRAPALVVAADWDVDSPPAMAQALFPKLVNATPKRLVVLGEGTHTMPIEKNRLQLFEAVQHFLEEK